MVALASFVDLYCTLQEVNYCDVADPRVLPQYIAKMSAPLTFERALPEVSAGVMSPQFASVSLSNVNTALATEGSRYGTYISEGENGYGDFPYGGVGAVTLSELMAVEDLRGKRARGRIFDLDTSTLLYTVDGVISQPQAGGANASFRIESRQNQVLRQLLPLHRIVDFYPSADLTGAADQDAPVIKPFGIMRKVRLVAVREVSGAYDYGLFYKPSSGTLTLNTVYREDRVMGTTSYTFVEVVPGTYVVRFALDPRENGRAVEIRATVTSTEFTYPSDAVRWVLQSLGQAADPTSFTAAIGAYNLAGYGPPAGGLAERRPALDILNDLLVRGSSLELNSSLAYVIRVDSGVLHPGASVALGAGDSRYQNADPDSVTQEVISDLDQVGTLKLLGAYDQGFGGDAAYLMTSTHTIPGGTITKEDPCPYIGDSATLDREASYRAKRYRYSTHALTLDADLEARVLDLGHLVPLWIPNDVINGESYELSRLRYEARRSGEDDIEAHFTCTFRGFNPDIFTYTPGVVQVSPGALTLIDYSFTIPEAPTSLVLVSETLQGSSGVSFVVHSATAPPVNVTELVFRAIPTSSVIPLAGAATVPCAPGQAGVQGGLTLTAGVSYTIQCYARNRNNAVGYQDGLITQILNYVPTGDTSVPPQVTGLAVTAGSYKSLNITWSGIADYTRLDNYEVFVSTNSGFTALVKILTPRSTDVSVTSLANGTTYFVRVRAVYNNRIPGAYSSIVSASTTRVANDDYGDGTISTNKYQLLSVTTAIMDNLAATNAKIGNLAVDDAKIANLSAAKITTGLLTVHPTTGGATAIYVDSGGKVRLRAMSGSPARISLEDGSGIEKGGIVGDSVGNMVIFSTGPMLNFLANDVEFNSPVTIFNLSIPHVVGTVGAPDGYAVIHDPSTNIAYKIQLYQG